MCRRPVSVVHSNVPTWLRLLGFLGHFVGRWWSTNLAIGTYLRRNSCSRRINWIQSREKWRTVRIYVGIRAVPCTKKLIGFNWVVFFASWSWEMHRNEEVPIMQYPIMTALIESTWNLQFILCVAFFHSTKSKYEWPWLKLQLNSIDCTS